MPNGVPGVHQRLEGQADAWPSRSRYGANSGAVHASRRAAARAPARRTSRRVSAVRQAANAAAPRGVRPSITPSHSRIGRRTSSPAGPGLELAEHRAPDGSAVIANASLWNAAKSSAVRSSRPRSSACSRAARCGGANSVPSRSLSLAAPLVGGDHLAVRRDVVARQVDPAVQPPSGVVGPGRCPAGWPRRRTGTRPALRNRTAPCGVGDDDVVDRLDPRVERAVDVVDGPGPQQRSRASKPRSPRTVAASRSAEPAAALAVDLEERPALGRPAPRRVTGSAPRTRDDLLVAVDHVVERLLEDVLVVGARRW